MENISQVSFNGSRKGCHLRERNYSTLWTKFYRSKCWSHMWGIHQNMWKYFQNISCRTIQTCFTTQTTHISTFNMGNTTNKISNIDTTTLWIEKLYIVASNLKCAHSNVKHQRQSPTWKTPVILPLPISIGKGEKG